MPLVTLTCSKKFYPPDCDFTDDSPTGLQARTLVLAEELPSVIAAHAVELGLDPAQTPAEGVQVDIQKFHSHAANAVDLWVHVQFAESYPGSEVALQARDIFIAILRGRMQGIEPEGLRALDMFWGPDHGCLFRPDSNRIKISW